MEPVVLNPAIPFQGIISNGLFPGKVVVVQGVVHHGATMFRVDLHCGNDIALHMNPRFDEGLVVRNSMTNGNWACEERHPPGLAGLARGQPFEVMILTETTHYKMAINGRHFTEFAHRLPFASVNTLKIAGNVQVNRIEFRLNYIAPVIPVQPGYNFVVFPSGPPLVPSSKHRPIYNPAIPLKCPILGGLEPGLAIRVSGRPTNMPHRIGIDICCDNSPSSDIALHLNIRFDQFCVVRNSYVYGNWGAEERVGGFPFQAAVNFDLILRVQPSHFEISINGQYFAAFQHRVLPLNRANFLNISGDVVISSVSYL